MADTSIRPPAELRLLPGSALSDAEYIALMEHSYRQHDGCSCRISLLEFMGMTADEYAGWTMHGIVPERLMRVARRR